MFAFLLTACTEPDEGKPALDVDPLSLDFGAVPAGSESALSFAITNSGGGELSVLSVSLIEGSEYIYALSRAADGSLAGGASEIVEVSFAPDESGETYEGRIQIRTDAATEYVSLTGLGAESTTDNDGDGYSPADGDCNDGNASTYPGADEICDGADNDCNGAVPSDEADADYDGWLVCEGDCNDSSAAVYPDAPEVCDDEDSDCDGVSADRDDLDGDGFTVCDDDCDDGEATVFPGGTEVCDELDNDCSGEPDDLDVDEDGFSTCQGDCDDADPSSYPIYVAKDGSSAGDGSPENPFDSLADGLDAVRVGCPTVLVGEGRYEEALTWSAGDVTLVPDGDVVLEPPDDSRALEVLGGSFTVSNITFRGGSPTGDGGAVRVDGGSFIATGCTFTENECTGDGGAIAVSAGTLTLDGCTLDTNVAADDGGAISVLSAILNLTDTTLTGNTAVRGGALQLESATGTLSGLTITENVAADQGGGVEIIGGANLELVDLDIWLNQSGARGGGISLVDVGAQTVWLRRLSILDNAAGETGGGVAYNGSVAAGLFANNTLGGNSAPGGGAGVDIDVTDGGALFAWSNILISNDGLVGFAADGTYASVAYNHVYGTTSGSDFDLGVNEDMGDNDVENPVLRSYTSDGDPSNDQLNLQSTSPCRNTGPESGGPDAYDWRDTDGSRNDRGATGGPQN